MNACLTTRVAKQSDLVIVLELFMSALEEMKSDILEPDLDTCAMTVARGFLSAPCVLLENDNEIVGFAGLEKSCAGYTKKPQLSEYMFFVKPENRSIKAIKKLSKACQDVADKMRLPLFMTYTAVYDNMQSKKSVLERLGYKPFAISISYGV